MVIFLASLLDFSVAIVLSAGLDHTCSAFGEAAGQDQPYVKVQLHLSVMDNFTFLICRCSLYHLEFPDNSSVAFYGNLTTAKVSGMTETVWHPYLIHTPAKILLFGTSSI